MKVLFFAYCSWDLFTVGVVLLSREFITNRYSRPHKNEGILFTKLKKL
jgi:hypothetical protein